MRWLRGVLCYAMVSMGLMSGPSHAGEMWRQALPAVHLLGSGEMTWLGLRIYRATLWTAQSGLDPAQPFALQLTYNMSISRARLVRTSMDEIRRLSASPIAAETQMRWKLALERTLVDVDTDDQLIGIYLPGRGMQLYSADKLLGEIDDMDLARAFFDIWLNPATRDPALRKRLLGQ